MSASLEKFVFCLLNAAAEVFLLRRLTRCTTSSFRPLYVCMYAIDIPPSLNFCVVSLNLHVLHSLGFAEFGRLYSRTLLQGSGVGVHYYVLCSAKIDFIISICKEIALYGTFHVRRLKNASLSFSCPPL